MYNAYTESNFTLDNNNDIKLNNSNIDNYDAIISSSDLFSSKKAIHIMNSFGNCFYKKLMCGVHSNPKYSFNHFNEWFSNNTNITWLATSNDVYSYVKNVKGFANVKLVTPGTIVSKYHNRDVINIKTLGLSGMDYRENIMPKGWLEIKRPEMLVEIANKANLNVKFCFGKSWTEYTHIYDDIDMYVCTSLHDVGPYGIVECALSKIPVISTHTGISKQIKSIKKFKSVDEAINIINELNRSPTLLKRYIEDVYNEVKDTLNLDKIVVNEYKKIIEEL